MLQQKTISDKKNIVFKFAYLLNVILYKLFQKPKYVYQRRKRILKEFINSIE